MNREDIKLLVIASVISILTFFCGRFSGENVGLRQQDSQTIQNLRQVNQEIAQKYGLSLRFVQEIAKRDSTGFIRREAQRLNLLAK